MNNIKSVSEYINEQMNSLLEYSDKIERKYSNTCNYIQACEQTNEINYDEYNNACSDTYTYSDILDIINCQLVDYQDILNALDTIRKATANIAVGKKYLDEITKTWEV